MKNYYFSIGVVICLIAVILAGCAAPSAAPEKTWDLKFSHEHPTTGAYHIYGHEPWAKDVERVTNGRVKVTIYPAQTLLKTPEVWEGVKSGVADVGWLFTGAYAGQFDLAESVSLPFVVPSATAGGRTNWALFQKYPEIQSQFADNKVLSIFTCDPYFFISNKKVFKTLDDFKGVKMRAMAGPQTEMVKALGAIPLYMGMPDVYLNLQKGVMDAALTLGEAHLAFKLYEVASNITYLNTTVACAVMFMNKKVWESMPPDIQKAIMSVSGDYHATRVGRDCFDKITPKMPSEIKSKGYPLTEYKVPADELAKWDSVAGKPVRDAWVKNMEAKGYKNASKILEDAIKMAKEFNK